MRNLQYLEAGDDCSKCPGQLGISSESDGPGLDMVTIYLHAALLSSSGFSLVFPLALFLRLRARLSPAHRSHLGM